MARDVQRMFERNAVPLAVAGIVAAGLAAVAILNAGPGLPGAKALQQTRHASKPALAAPAATILPRLNWQPLPQVGTPLTRIGFGSCLHQNRPQPIWRSVISTAPELFLMLGDNVYGDIKSPDGRELPAAYAKLAASKEFAAARAAFPVLATWDDHDYGQNDGGADFSQRKFARATFNKFWQGSGSTGAADPDGIFYARTFGLDGKRVQIIMLDTRSFRSPLKRKPRGTLGKGKYVPDKTPGKTILGERQWQWLAEQLTQPADVRMIASSIQILADSHGWERWGNLPAERKRLYDLIRSTRANGVVFLSGDRHRAAIYRNDTAGPYPLYEATSSSLNMAFDDPSEKGPFQLERMFGKANFGMLEIDWDKRVLTVTIRGPDGQAVRTRQISLADLRAR